MKDRFEDGKSGLQTAVEVAMVICAVAIVLYAFSRCCTSWCEFCPLTVLRVLAVGAGVAAASWTVGGLFGFLFSIPRAGAENSRIEFPDNSNLVDISDWLTKILVGAGLVTLTKIPPKMRLLAEYVGTNGFGDQKDGAVFALALIILSSVCGFLWVYVWTRVNFARVLSDSRTELKKAVKAATESPVATLLLRALSLPQSLKDEESAALRDQARFMARSELAENSDSRKIAVMYGRLLDEQFSDRKKAEEILEETLTARRKKGIAPDADDAALHYNLACYINRDAKAEKDAKKKEALTSQARDHLNHAIKLDPKINSEAKEDLDVADLLS